MNNNLNDALKVTLDAVSELLQESHQVLIAVDGMSGSGKTTFANALSKIQPSTLIHMDDFFLRPEQRTEERLSTPGGNADIERLLDEVVMPIYNDKNIIYRPFDCQTMDFLEPQTIEPKNTVIIEGSYSCHPKLFDFFDLHIFLYTDTVKQIDRILKRNGYEKAKIFVNKWIPLENKYFEYYKIKDKCELKFYI